MRIRPTDNDNDNTVKRLPVRLMLLLAWAVSTGSFGNESPPLDCPHCGDWELTTSAPWGAVGERLTIDATSVSLPTCGEFKPEVLSQSSALTTAERRVYRTSLKLHPRTHDLLCTVPQGSTLRMDIEVSVGFHNDGGQGQFSVFKPGESIASLVVGGWNFARDNPCDSGSGDGSAACLQIANARMYRNLAQVVFAAYALPPPGKSSRRKGDFNPARFAAATRAFCLKRHAEDGGGSWPFVWALNCQAERLQAKLNEFHDWRSCAVSGSNTCQFPNEIFDKSARDDPP